LLGHAKLAPALDNQAAKAADASVVLKSVPVYFWRLHQGFSIHQAPGTLDFPARQRKHRSNEGYERQPAPAYVIDARFGIRVLFGLH
jgi:hypothetical protein